MADKNLEDTFKDFKQISLIETELGEYEVSISTEIDMDMSYLSGKIDDDIYYAEPEEKLTGSDRPPVDIKNNLIKRINNYVEKDLLSKDIGEQLKSNITNRTHSKILDEQLDRKRYIQNQINTIKDPQQKIEFSDKFQKIIVELEANSPFIVRKSFINKEEIPKEAIKKPVSEDIPKSIQEKLNNISSGVKLNSWLRHYYSSKENSSVHQLIAEAIYKEAKFTELELANFLKDKKTYSKLAKQKTTGFIKNSKQWIKDNPTKIFLFGVPIVLAGIGAYTGILNAQGLATSGSLGIIASEVGTFTVVAGIMVATGAVAGISYNVSNRIIKRIARSLTAKIDSPKLKAITAKIGFGKGARITHKLELKAENKEGLTLNSFKKMRNLVNQRESKPYHKKIKFLEYGALLTTIAFNPPVGLALTGGYFGIKLGKDFIEPHLDMMKYNKAISSSENLNKALKKSILTQNFALGFTLLNKFPGKNEILPRVFTDLMTVENLPPKRELILSKTANIYRAISADFEEVKNGTPSNELSNMVDLKIQEQKTINPNSLNWLINDIDERNYEAKEAQKTEKTFGRYMDMPRRDLEQEAYKVKKDLLSNEEGYFTASGDNILIQKDSFKRQASKERLTIEMINEAIENRGLHEKPHFNVKGAFKVNKEKPLDEQLSDFKQIASVSKEVKRYQTYADMALKQPTDRPHGTTIRTKPADLKENKESYTILSSLRESKEDLVKKIDTSILDKSLNKKIAKAIKDDIAEFDRGVGIALPLVKLDEAQETRVYVVEKQIEEIKDPFKRQEAITKASKVGIKLDSAKVKNVRKLG
jgi:hypothetical protein